MSLVSSLAPPLHLNPDLILCHRKVARDFLSGFDNVVPAFLLPMAIKDLTTLCHLSLNVLPWSPSIYRIKTKALEGNEDPSFPDSSSGPCHDLSPIPLGWHVRAVYSSLSSHNQKPSASRFTWEAAHKNILVQIKTVSILLFSSWRKKNPDPDIRGLDVGHLPSLSVVRLLGFT